jgi:hypothetical protein
MADAQCSGQRQVVSDALKALSRASNSASCAERFSNATAFDEDARRQLIDALTTADKSITEAK